MSLEYLLIGAGLLLVLAGFFGGGLEVQQIKVPKIGGVLRLLSCLVGLIFVAVGLYIRAPANKDEAEAGTIKPFYSSPVEFTIYDKLGNGGENQSETFEIEIDGKPRGNISTNTVYPESSMLFTVQSEGSHSYYLKAHAEFLAQNKKRTIDCIGEGNIMVKHGSRFLLDANYDEAGSCFAPLIEK
jgi:hypothetical protein